MTRRDLPDWPMIYTSMIQVEGRGVSIPKTLELSFLLCRSMSHASFTSTLLNLYTEATSLSFSSNSPRQTSAQFNPLCKPHTSHTSHYSKTIHFLSPVIPPFPKFEILSISKLYIKTPPSIFRILRTSAKMWITNPSLPMPAELSLNVCAEHLVCAADCRSLLHNETEEKDVGDE